MEKSKSILISGYYGFDNSGDDAILKAMVKDFKERDTNLNLTALSYNPPFTRKVYQIDAVNRFSIGEVREGIKKSDMLISGGGSLLQDITSTRSLLYYLSIINLAKYYKKKVMIYANGVGPINGKINRRLTKKTLEKADLITLRDQDSVDFLKELGVKNPNVHLTADPVFMLDAQPYEKVKKVFEDESIPLDKPLIGISIREWSNSKKIIEELSKTIAIIAEKYDANILLIPMHYPEDLNISKELLSSSSNRIYILSKKYPVDYLMGIINQLELLVAMRLHSLIYAASQGVPMVGLVYDPKIIGFLKSIDINTMLDVDSLSADNLVDNIDYVWENRQDIRKNLLEKEHYLKDEAIRNTDLALDLLEK